MSASTTLPTFPTTAEILVSLQAALEALNPLLSNYNAGGATETYLEAASLLTGSDASTYPGVIQQGAYELLTIVQASAFILTASGNWLDLKAADFGVTRKPAAAASGPVQFTLIVVSVTDTVIPAGALVAAESADPTALPAVYATQAATVIPAGATVSGVVTALATTAGANTNQNVVGAVNTVVSGASNVSVLSVGTMGGGADTEGDDAPNGGLRARALQAVANASQCTLSAIQATALAFAGITSARAVDINSDPTIPRAVVSLYVDDGSGDLANPGWHGTLSAQTAAGALIFPVTLLAGTPEPGDAFTIDAGTDAETLEVASYDGTAITATTPAADAHAAAAALANGGNANYAILEIMQQAFDSGLYRGAGIEVNVLGSELLPTVVGLTVLINATYATVTSSAASVIAAVQLAVYDYVQSIGIGNPVLLSEIIRVAAEVAGVSDVPISAVMINGASVNLQPTNVQAPRAQSLASVTVAYRLVSY